ncbi:Hypothetical_protein [Hexamita inflata]|uniref:Hypothetical_protein n=1 Tax=Hexamita inflata TaxID=28002 RepID=A0AA86TAN9_9EUKA|nr:Hypothetical protein HINF_LOCUS675 [Hexamita inflata]
MQRGEKHRLPKILESITNSQTHHNNPSSSYFTRFQYSIQREIKSVVHEVNLDLLKLDNSQTNHMIKYTKANIEDSIIQLKYLIRTITDLEAHVSRTDRNIEIIIRNQTILKKQM